MEVTSQKEVQNSFRVESFSFSPWLDNLLVFSFPRISIKLGQLVGSQAWTIWKEMILRTNIVYTKDMSNFWVKYQPQSLNNLMILLGMDRVRKMLWMTWKPGAKAYGARSLVSSSMFGADPPRDAFQWCFVSIETGFLLKTNYRRLQTISTRFSHWRAASEPAD